jgi:peptidoglycan hydrolase-like protein with peptidoglycan-binding domain
VARARATAAATLAFVAVAGAGGCAAVGGRADGAARGTPGATAGPATGTAEVVRTTVSHRDQVNGTLGYAGTHSLVAGAPGTLTRLPAVGDVVPRGEPAYEVDGRPVVLLYGARPAWRELAAGAPDGADVRQLEANLAALGHGAGMTVDRHFSAATAVAVRRWQRAAHLPVTGTVPLGQVVFAPGALRVGGYDATAGAQVQPGTAVLHGTGERREVTAAVDPARLPDVRVGDPVVVTLPDSTARDGRITAVGARDTGGDGGDGGGPGGGPGGPEGPDGPPTVPISVAVTGTVPGFLDHAQVMVAMTREQHADVLAVPVTALRALPGARYEVVVVGAGGSRRHVPVEIGLFDETTGLAEVTGPGLVAGARVEVPGDGA